MACCSKNFKPISFWNDPWNPCVDSCQNTFTQLANGGYDLGETFNNLESGVLDYPYKPADSFRSMTTLSLPITVALQVVPPWIHLSHAESLELKLTTACSDGDVSAVRRLLKEGVDPNGAEPLGKKRGDRITPLFLAAFGGQDKVVALLLKAGAKPNLTMLRRNEKVGLPPLTAAVNMNRRESVRLLLQAGANPLQKNELGQTPYSAALRRRDLAMAALLKRYIH